MHTTVAEKNYPKWLLEDETRRIISQYRLKRE